MAKLGLVLSGGGIRGVAHIGMLKVLEGHGLLDDIELVVGTSAGSIIGAMFALGYTPDEMWEIWQHDAWKMLGGKPNPAAVEDWNLGGVVDALVHFDLARFKGAVKGDVLLHAMNTYLVRNPQGVGVQPTGRAMPLYVVATHLNTGAETVWRFTKHIPPSPLEEAPGFIEALGRRQHWRVFDEDDADIATFPTIAQACRCSSSVPFIFEPSQAPTQRRNEALDTSDYTDGGVRDNYSLSTAIKLAECDQVIGMFLDSVDSYDRNWHGLLDLALRTIDQMGRTIFEADQDDYQIRVADIRTLVPRFGAGLSTFDVDKMQEIYAAGKDVTTEFLQRVQDKAGKLDWETIFKTRELNPLAGSGALRGAAPRAQPASPPGPEAAPPAEVKYLIYEKLVTG
jgi:predicted acylesterase/phospholipase RssA